MSDLSPPMNPGDQAAAPPLDEADPTGGLMGLIAMLADSSVESYLEARNAAVREAQAAAEAEAEAAVAAKADPVVRRRLRAAAARPHSMVFNFDDIPADPDNPAHDGFYNWCSDNRIENLGGPIVRPKPVRPRLHNNVAPNDRLRLDGSPFAAHAFDGMDRDAALAELARRPAPCALDPGHGHGDGCGCGHAHAHPAVPHLEYMAMDDGHPDTRQGGDTQYFEDLYRREAAEDRERIGLGGGTDDDGNDSEESSPGVSDDDGDGSEESSPGVSDDDDGDEIDMSGELMYDLPLGPDDVAVEVDGPGESPVAVAAIVGRRVMHDLSKHNPFAVASAEDEDNEDGYIELEAEEDVAVKVPLLTVTSNSPARPAGHVKVGPHYAAGSPPGLAELTGSDMSQKRDLLLAARRGSDNLTIVPKRGSPIPARLTPTNFSEPNSPQSPRQVSTV